MAPNASTEYLKTFRRRMHNGEIEYRLRFQVEGEADLKVWRSTAALRKDRPLLQAFLRAQKAKEATTAPTDQHDDDDTEETQPPAAQTVDCVVCLASKTEGAAHTHNDICSECWTSTVSGLDRAQRIQLLVAARAGAAARRGESLQPARISVHARSVRAATVRQTHATACVSNASPRMKKYYAAKKAGICVKCSERSVLNYVHCDKHMEQSRLASVKKR